MSEQKVSPYNQNELKNTSDDALCNYLKSLSFQQDNSKTDVKLAVGWTAVVIAAITFVADYKLGWEKTKYWTTAAVIVYTTLNSFFTYWLWYVENGLIFEGTRNGKKISLRSRTKKYDPSYHVDISTSTTSTPVITRHIQAPFTTWFTADGYFVAKPFQQWLASSIEEVGDADGKHAMRDQRDDLAAPSICFSKTTGTETAGTSTKRSKAKR